MKDVRNLIEEQFSANDESYDDDLLEDSVFKKKRKKTNNTSLDWNVTPVGSFSYNPEKFSVGGYKGKAVSRKSLEAEDTDNDLEGASEDQGLRLKDCAFNDSGNDSCSYVSKTVNKKKRKSSIINNRKKNFVSDSEDDGIVGDESIDENDGNTLEDNEGAEKESRTEDETSDDSVIDDDEVDDESAIDDDEVSGEENEEDNSSFLYSKIMRDDEKDHAKKGAAVKCQLRLWEYLLECRITLQKCLADVNRFPKPEKFEEIWNRCSEEEKNAMTESREFLWDLLERFIFVQNYLRNHCAEFKKTLEADELEELNVNDTDYLKLKRRKLTDYPTVLENQRRNYVSYRNSAIQKWNERTKIATGRMAKSNFTAFDQPVLKQIEQILSDKHRLIQRTFVKRTQYDIIGENSSPCETENDNEPVTNNVDETDPEIFDDDDFYHKLLRDYIERKTADISDPNQLGKKWIKLQKLRSKMKRKFDTRSTKGRKIKYDVHQKLVNFMAPISFSSWTETSTNELFNSLFGKKQ